MNWPKKPRTDPLNAHARMDQYEEKISKEFKQIFSRNPALKAVYDFKQRLMKIILTRVYNKRDAMRIIPQFWTQLGP